jgi:hypothetical protein
MSLASRNVAHLHLIVETKESRIVLQRRGSERARSAGGPSVQASLHPTMRRKHSSAPPTKPLRMPSLTPGPGLFALH